MNICISNAGKPECSTIKLSNIDEESDDRTIKMVLGTYQYIGEWKDVGSPIYRMEKEDRVNSGPFYLYYSSKQWVVSEVRDLLCFFKLRKWKITFLFKCCF